MPYVRDYVDVVVIGAGHAGCEAALASARLGLKTVILSISLDSIAMMPCNPSIGGSSKGHLVREIDALGGEMGKNIDETFIQSRMLNTGKGPAVYSLRAQADKHEYSKRMKEVLEQTENLQIVQGEASDILVSQSKIEGVLLLSGAIFYANAVIIASGTYVCARCLYGNTIIESGPNGLKSAVALRESLKALNINLFRFKTGTPARIDKKTIDFSKMEIQKGDVPVVPFSFETDPSSLDIEQIPCYLTYTNSLTHEIIKKNISRSPMYSGVIQGTGTRYCPSIEDKIVRFADKERHQIFIEPEGLSTDEMYVQGMSTSLPEDVQISMYRSVKGLENCHIMRNAYAIEYDCIDATQLKLTLEFKEISGLYSAGQFNGSSGYEEAAAQGLIAGINAALKIQNKAPLILDRSDAYIGVLIDDLVTKGTKEPYRMMTSRAEYRLLLRQDNADLRLTPIGYSVGLISKQRFDNFLVKKQLIETEIKRINSTIIAPGLAVNDLLSNFGSSIISTGIGLNDLIKRPELDYFKLQPIDTSRTPLPLTVQEQAGIQIKYEGYINKQEIQVSQFKKLENKLLPTDIDYLEIKGLRLEARQKLNALRPNSVGHASRITGVSPADISVLLVYLAANSK